MVQSYFIFNLSRCQLIDTRDQNRIMRILLPKVRLFSLTILGVDEHIEGDQYLTVPFYHKKIGEITVHKKLSIFQ